MAPKIEFAGYNKLFEIANQVFDDLDKKDGKQDGKISKDIWNQYAAQYQSRGIEATNKKSVKKSDDLLKTIATRVVAYVQGKKDIRDSYAKAGIQLPGEEVNDTVAESSLNMKENDLTVPNQSNDSANNLRAILAKAGITVNDEEFQDALTKYENKLALKESMGYTDASIQSDIIDYLNARQNYNTIEDNYRDTYYDILQMNPSEHSRAVNDADNKLQAYEIEGIQEALDYAEETGDTLGAYKKQSEAYQKFGNAQVQLYDENGDNLISLEEFVAYEEERQGYEYTDEDVAAAMALFDFLKGDDEYIDAKEMTLDGYAKAKIFDNKEHQSGAALSFKEWACMSQTFKDYSKGKRDKITMENIEKYKQWRDMGNTVIYNYEQALKK